MSWKYFTEDEFKCKCCGKVKIDPNLIDVLDEARDFARRPFVITSGYRCPIHNLAVGGSPTSSHLKGYAADIACTDTTDRYMIVKALIRARASRIEVASSWIHVDVDTSKKHPSLFLEGE